MKRSWFKGALAAAFAAAAAIAGAHNFHAGISDVSFNPRSGSTEIVHTYMAHDVEALLANLYQRQFDLSTPEDQEVFRKYVEQQFWVLGADQRKLSINWVGMTADVSNVMVFQELPQTPLSKAAAIHDAVMIDFLPDQVNTVNINEGGSVHTLSFDARKTEQRLR